jgi:hypothetical protein
MVGLAKAISPGNHSEADQETGDDATGHAADQKHKFKSFR